MDEHNSNPLRKAHQPWPDGISGAAVAMPQPGALPASVNATDAAPGALLDAMLNSLPETRATQRLLGVLGKLEAYHANLAAANGAALPGRVVSGTAITSELARLRQENRHLKLRQRHAIEHLDALMARLPEDEADAPAPLVHSLMISDTATDVLPDHPATEHAA